MPQIKPASDILLLWIAFDTKSAANVPLMTDVNKRRSEKMKQNFKDGKIKGWVINNSKDRRSYPESFFIKVFKNDNLYEKYNIEEKFSYGKYFIDFLFVFSY